MSIILCSPNSQSVIKISYWPMFECGELQWDRFCVYLNFFSPCPVHQNEQVSKLLADFSLFCLSIKNINIRILKMEN